ncbi:ABC transporter permease [uncultured Paraglaciecola sp.]|jgi:ABC-2 type transport system permease protein|uniref:ABC transporter permease n=1 Tax=uncultured Paraglaciecola sp. TaxID=1765024 RepID=UPI0026140C1E|nr:ABC transporter permease [uncultured Paraglaciecola sp.]
MDKVLLVARWEFMRNFKWKQELIGYFLMLLIYAAIFAVQMWSQSSTQKTINIAVIGQLQTELNSKFVLSSLDTSVEEQQLFEKIAELSLDGILKVDQSDEFTLYIAQQSVWQQELEQALVAEQKDILLRAMDISPEQLKKLQNPISMTFVNQAEEVVGSSVKVLGLLAAILSAMAVFTSFGLSLTSVTQEKQHRITEQLLTCISHQEWVDGKALGLCLSSIKSLLTTCFVMAIVFTGVAVFSDGGSETMNVSATVMIQILIFCVTGVLFWNYVFVGFAATIDDPNHSGKTGLMLLPMLPVMLVFIVMGEPNGQVATVLSLVPLTSISFMPMRIASMSVPVWQVGLSLVFLMAGVYYVRLFATRVFRANITLFGKEPDWADIWRSMLKSNP